MKLEVTFEKKKVRDHIIHFHQYDWRAKALGAYSRWMPSPNSALNDLLAELPEYFKLEDRP